MQPVKLTEAQRQILVLLSLQDPLRDGCLPAREIARRLRLATKHGAHQALRNLETKGLTWRRGWLPPNLRTWDITPAGRALLRDDAGRSEEKAR